MNPVKSASFLAAALLTVAPLMAATNLSYYDSDTRTNSASATDPFASPGDTNPGSLKYSTGSAGGGNKVAVTFYKSGSTAGLNGAPSYDVLGTLGTLNQLSFDYYQDSASTGPGGTLAPAVRLKLSPLGTTSATYIDLVYEPVYQSGFSGTSPKDAWQDNVNVFGGTFWQRSNGLNHDGAPDFQSLASFVGGYTPTYNGPGVALNANTPIYGVEISYGSGLPNNFAAYVDDVKVGFSTGDSFAANVPEPTSLALLGLGAVGALRRRRDA